MTKTGREKSLRKRRGVGYHCARFRSFRQSIAGRDSDVPVSISVVDWQDTGWLSIGGRSSPSRPTWILGNLTDASPVVRVSNVCTRPRSFDRKSPRRGAMILGQMGVRYRLSFDCRADRPLRRETADFGGLKRGVSARQRPLPGVPASTPDRIHRGNRNPTADRENDFPSGWSHLSDLVERIRIPRLEGLFVAEKRAVFCEVVVPAAENEPVDQVRE